ncbi:MAG: hypothetical protein CMB80_14770 [Flammeovirgaceae bacterium]|nr:hypothetical protein [Flammeovirgaceae bacterium]MBE62828.1 hypothetical protein [Flammeovirgaceae bacterium]MBR08675.1 hypothetical protein [Rickettsiales bacterium]HCX25114.1 hypothetical protein [Cytophagales bacterium]|tara:strand:+ start:2231 stop:2584 length:354 start_codon:yes stop_codon:yes gene_type:complete
MLRKTQIVKELITYAAWSMLALLLGMVYMRLVLGPNDTSEEGFWYLLHLFYDIGLVYVGFWIGVAIALCFVLLDVFFLRKKMTINPKNTVLRLVIMMVIAVIIGIIHYLLEKVIDVI